MALSRQVPLSVKLTTPPLMEHMADDEESTVMLTAPPEVAVATGVYVGPPLVAAGALEVNWMVFAACPTLKVMTMLEAAR